MRGDDDQADAVGESGLRERRGPRHAAPRKSLLTKLHMPAGKKAFALAAMPTAVFVGMGLTPKLAMADDNVDIPFAPGPCVTRSDEPSESASPSASATKPPSPSVSASDKVTPDRSDGATPKPSATPSASASGDTAADSAKKSTDAPAATPSATPPPTKSKNPLDPLGLGDTLKDLFDGPDKETAAPSPSATTASPKPSASATGTATEKAADKPVEKATDAVKDTADKTADAIRDAADKAGKPVEELDGDVKGLDPKKDEDIPDGAKPSFPCPTADPKALAAADLEQGIPRLPNDPWILESSLLTLNGLDYKGIVEVEKGDGSTKKVLKFTASSVDIKDLHQLTVGPMSDVTGHVKARKGSTSTIRDGTVTMYTEELKGNLFGLIPITFSPQTPPPLNVPFAFFTKVKVTQAGQFGGTLTVPGLQNYFTKGAN
ncbi:hypothetical protein [Streptomyces brevispora]|uniref:Hydrogenase expression protein HypF n=1 Tax=Streptomyces brevispora TaxID=887462 RepID=A0A561V2F5_9ACTN|nr:hypothetical protein [Streptomyces brevispora]TWG05763.1 hypothetical protein FHX80_114243 [Streptomyces brevispora]WSC13250.1 hypothetical protein OIE64_10685 [Streptomyces brevispora]